MKPGRFPIRSVLFAAVIFIAGGILGPVALAAATALLQPKDEMAQAEEVSRLMDAYQTRLPPNILFLTLIPPEDGKECGYDPAALFGEDSLSDMILARRSGGWHDYEGYYALDRWRNEHRDQDFLFAIQERLDGKLSAFEAAFLRRCIESTIFAPSCMAKINSIGEPVDRKAASQAGYQIASDREDRVVCGYVDGVAARRGISLAPRSD